MPSQAMSNKYYRKNSFFFLILYNQVVQDADVGNISDASEIVKLAWHYVDLAIPALGWTPRPQKAEKLIARKLQAVSKSRTEKGKCKEEEKVRFYNNV